MVTLVPKARDVGTFLQNMSGMENLTLFERSIYIMEQAVHISLHLTCTQVHHETREVLFVELRVSLIY